MRSRRRIVTTGLTFAAAICMVLPGALVADAVADQDSPSPSPRVTYRSAPDGILGSWSALGGGANNTVRALLMLNGTLYAGGDFSEMRTSQGTGVSGSSRVAQWSQGAWSPLQTGANDWVFALASQDNSVIVGGWFTSVSGTSTAGMASWSGSAWQSLASSWTDAPGCGNGFQVVYGLAATDDTVFAGGCFGSINGVPSQSISAYSGGTWSSMHGGLTQGFNGQQAWVNDLAMQDDTLIVGGNFTIPGSQAGSIAAWSDDTWRPLGSGANDSVSAVAVRGSHVFASGSFTQMGGTSASGIAQWDGSGWSALGPGLDGAGEAIAIDDTRGLLYVGGTFTGSGSTSLSSVAVWDFGVDEWIPFRWGAGSGDVGIGGLNALALDDSVVYAGGSFSDAGGDTRADYVARWSWEPPTGNVALSGAPGGSATITAEGLIGVVGPNAVRFGSTAATSYTRDDSATIQATVPLGLTPGDYPIYVDGVGGTGQVGVFTIPAERVPVPPVNPPSAPRDVAAVPGDASAVVTWQAPQDSGSFPVTSYLATAWPGGRTCLTSTLSCSIVGLTNGRPYTVMVQALNGAGWSAASVPSAVVTPAPSPSPTLVLIGSRSGRTLTFAGTASGLPPGSIVTASVRFPDRPEASRAREVVVGADGTFSWSRRAAPTQAVTAWVTRGDIRSNVVRLPGGSS